VLPARGIAVARFDRRGYDVPWDDQVADAMAVVTELRSRRDIDRDRVGLWGFSQGAWIAPLAAARSTEIAFLVLLASTGVSPSRQMLYGTARHARMAGFGEDAAERIVAARRVIDDFRRGRVAADVAQREIDAIKDQPWFEHAYIARDVSEIGPWPDMDLDPETIFSGVRVPTLLFYGEDDEWSPIDESIAAWRRAAKTARNDAVTIVRLPGTKHFPTIGGEERIDAISPEYERTLVEWLRRITR
jgi:uncharacterized protein